MESQRHTALDGRPQLTQGAVHTTDHAELGGIAAEQIFMDREEHRAKSPIEDPFTTVFAAAVIETFRRLHSDGPGAYHAVIRAQAPQRGHAERTAVSGNRRDRPERRRPGRDGSLVGATQAPGSPRVTGRTPTCWRVDVRDVLPMAFPYLTTKARTRSTTPAEDVGIGLKTLDRLGGQLAVHCRPRFTINGDDLAVTSAPRPITASSTPAPPADALRAPVAPGDQPEALRRGWRNRTPPG